MIPFPPNTMVRAVTSGQLFRVKGESWRHPGDVEVHPAGNSDVTYTYGVDDVEAYEICNARPPRDQWALRNWPATIRCTLPRGHESDHLDQQRQDHVEWTWGQWRDEKI